MVQGVCTNLGGYIRSGIHLYCKGWGVGCQIPQAGWGRSQRVGSEGDPSTCRLPDREGLSRRILCFAPKLSRNPRALQSIKLIPTDSHELGKVGTYRQPGTTYVDGGQR